MAGSDLKELCAAAMQECVAEDEEQEQEQGQGQGQGQGGPVGVLTLSHFEAACR